MRPTELISSKEIEHHYLLVCKDGSRAFAPSVDLAKQRIQRMTKSPVMMSYRVHPDTTITANGYIKYPDGFPPEDIDIKRGKEWSAIS